MSNDVSRGIDLSLLLIRACNEAGIEFNQGVKFIDALVGLGNLSAERILAERARVVRRRRERG